VLEITRRSVARSGEYRVIWNSTNPALTPLKTPRRQPSKGVPFQLPARREFPMRAVSRNPSCWRSWMRRPCVEFDEVLVCDGILDEVDRLGLSRPCAGRNPPPVRNNLIRISDRTGKEGNLTPSHGTRFIHVFLPSGLAAQYKSLRLANRHQYIHTCRQPVPVHNAQWRPYRSILTVVPFHLPSFPGARSLQINN